MVDLFDDRYGAPGRHTVYRCQSCGFGRTYPGLKPEEIGQFYARYYPLAKLSPEAVSRQARVRPRLQAWLAGTNNTAHWHIKPGEKVLDIGSAAGVSLLEIKQLGGEPYGVEPDPGAAQLAKTLGLPVHSGFIEDQPFGAEQFDVITASQVIEHTPDPRAFLAAVARRLRNDGQVILSFPNLDAFYRKIFGRRWLHWHVPYHYNFFTRRSFELLAELSGLVVVKWRTITPNLWTIIQLKQLFEKSIEGRPGSIWANQYAKNQTPQKLEFDRIFRYALLRSGLFLVAPINRLIDLLGGGESFLVWLKKEDS